MATDLLARIRGELNERMAELHPLLGEYERLIAAADTLASIEAEPAPPDGSPAARTPSEPRTQSAAPRRRARAPRGSAAGVIERAASTPTAIEAVEPAASAGAVQTHELAVPPTSTSTLGASAETPEYASPGPTAAETDQRAALYGPDDEEDEPEREPASPEAVQQAILAALEHGSHTASELVMVTAMSGSEIRGNIGRLARQGQVTKVKRHGDGKSAYALPSASMQV